LETEPASVETAPDPELGPAEAAVEAEPPLIEVWHPHRQHHQKHAAPRNQRNRAPRHGASVPAQTPETVEAGAAAAPPNREGQDNRPRGDRPRNENRRPQPRRDNQKQNQDATVAPPIGAGQEQAAKPHFDNRRGKSGPKGQRPDEHRQDRDRQDRQNKPANPPRPARERQPDPNSPFAKLLELKARLENNADSK
jgi:ATP-dependent RNA helicase SUPV3L1/SUV3